MKKSVKALLLVMCAIVLVVATVFTTLAYLQTTSQKVTNTFTVGNLQITLDESPVDATGKKAEGARHANGNIYKLIPGNTYDKDPIIHLQPNSEACWLFAEVDNGILAIEDATTIESQILAYGWTVLKTENSKTIYWKEAAAVAEDADAVDYRLFDTFTLKGDAAVADYANAEISILGYAVQKDGLDSAELAWNSTFGA